MGRLERGMSITRGCNNTCGLNAANHLDSIGTLNWHGGTGGVGDGYGSS